VESKREERRTDSDVAIDPEGNETRVLHDLVNFCNQDVVEIGCGDGRMTWRYADQTRSVLAIDTNAEAIEHASQTTHDALKSRVTFRVGDSARMVLPPASFDTAILSWSL